MNELVRIEGAQVEIDWGALLRRPLDEWTDDEKIVAMSVLDLVGKAVGERAEQLKVVLRTLALESGNGATRRLESAGVEIQVVQKAAQMKVNEAALLVLLQRLGMDRAVVFDTVPKLNEARLEQLIASGVLTDEQIRAFTEERSSSPALTVKRHIGGLTVKKLLEGG